MNRRKKCEGATAIPRAIPRAVALAAALVVMAPAVFAADEVDANTGNDVKVTWNNTFKYGAGFRIRDQDSALLRDPNADDGDRNFNKGLISNRIELLSELDAVTRNGFGARVSALGWYDTAYNRNNENPGFAGGAFPNQTSVAYNQFTRFTRNLSGRKAELRDAFVFGKADISGMSLTGRLGQHALVWGESLFFASNAIAGGQSAFDVSRLLADPTAQAKEFVLPVPQISAQFQVSPSLSLGAYYQFRFKSNRLPAVGSYFSSSDIAVDGAENLLLPTGLASREADQKPSNSGQFGLQAKWSLGDTDLGVYAIRFHDKSFQQVSRLGLAPAPFGILPTSYYLTYNEATTAQGVSASRSFGSINVAAEASVRQNQALASAGHAVDFTIIPFIPGPVNTNNSTNPGYAVGKTAHINVSTLWSLEPSALWREANFVGEIAWNRRLSCDVNCAALDPNATRNAVSMRAVFEPSYRQVLPGLDLSLPIGLGYTPKGSRSSLGPGFPPESGGDFTLGLNGVYEQKWRFSLAYTHYFGKAGTLLDANQSFSYQQTLRDRDFLALSVRRSF